LLTLPATRTPETLTTSSTPYQAETPEETALAVLALSIVPAPAEDDPIPRLDRYTMHSAILTEEREISVYLPEQYASEPERRFPVFYLHDGQNLFDGRKSYLAGRTWRAGETADRESRDGATEPLILVGVANTGLRRMAEYTPTRDFKMGGGEGRSYGRLLVEELKPFLDENYRTLPGQEDTGLGGSSLGGLISLFLGLEYPRIFGKLAVLSPSIWWDQRSILSMVAHTSPRPELKIWLDIGTAEGGRHVRDTDRLHRLLVERGWRDGIDLAYLRAEGGVHDEDAWAARFGDVLRFLFPVR
jgi:predicted alpha/beta superfamily hydrolase